MKQLNIRNTKITKLEKLLTNIVPEIEILDCSWNKISKIENLPNNLQTFDCDYNDILKLENRAAYQIVYKYYTVLVIK
jgi:Leucine-rich repeat (LRR) protein